MGKKQMRNCVIQPQLFLKTYKKRKIYIFLIDNYHMDFEEVIALIIIIFVALFVIGGLI